jgi:Activator of Hsp90 ATPase homolog 1-like protein
MISIPNKVEDLTLNITQEILVHASLEVTFATLLEQIGPQNETHDGKPMPLQIEPWPGGRWYRDLGENNGHLWAHVQAIKRPTLLEFAGPLFASFPFVSNVQYRLSEAPEGTLMSFRHTGLGFIQDQQKEQMTMGWNAMNERVRKHAEAAASRTSALQSSR